MTLRLIATGGTFDNHYNELTGVLGFSDSHLPDVVKRARLTVPVELQVLPLLDSLIRLLFHFLGDVSELRLESGRRAQHSCDYGKLQSDTNAT